MDVRLPENAICRYKSIAIFMYIHIQVVCKYTPTIIIVNHQNHRCDFNNDNVNTNN